MLKCFVFILCFGFLDFDVTNEDLYIVAKTIYYETRSEGEEGMRAVASVIWNRANGKHYKLNKVCKAPLQFSCWNSGSLEIPHEDDPEWVIGLKIAEEMFLYAFSPTIVADHYHATWVNSNWSNRMTFVKQIGKHLFYKSK